MMNVRPLHNEADYNWAIAEVTRYFDNEPALGSPDGDRFEVLTSLIKDYEDQHFPIDDADPIEVLEFAMESMGKPRSDLVNLFGRARTSEMLNRKRPLTLSQIRAISATWRIPIEALTQEYELVREYA